MPTSPAPAITLRLLTHPGPETMATAATPGPYTVRKYPAPGGWCRLLGYNGRGEPETELVILERKVTMDVIRRFQRFLRENDDRGDVRLIP